MIEIEMNAADMARVRFTTDPVWEAALSLHAITHPRRFPLHRRLRALVPEHPRFDLDLLLELARPGRFLPELLVPVPAPHPNDPLEQIAAVAGIDRALLDDDVRMLRLLLPGSRVATMRPGELAERTAVALTGYWRTVLEPLWERITAIHSADVVHRSMQASTDGLTTMLGGLHHLVTYSPELIKIDKGVGSTTYTGGGKGVWLMPSVFSWPRVVVAGDSRQPVLSYAARGAGRLWDGPAPAPANALAALLGRSRAAILELLDVPRSTTTLSEDLRLSPATVSQHLSVLTTAGLIHPTRQGKHVLYARTALATLLITPTHPT